MRFFKYARSRKRNAQLLQTPVSRPLRSHFEIVRRKKGLRFSRRCRNAAESRRSIGKSPWNAPSFLPGKIPGEDRILPGFQGFGRIVFLSGDARVKAAFPHRPRRLRRRRDGHSHVGLFAFGGKSKGDGAEIPIKTAKSDLRSACFPYNCLAFFGTFSTSELSGKTHGDRSSVG